MVENSCWLRRSLGFTAYWFRVVRTFSWPFCTSVSSSIKWGDHTSYPISLNERMNIFLRGLRKITSVRNVLTSVPGQMLSKCLLLFLTVFLLLPKCSLPHLPPFPRTAGPGVGGHKFSCWRTCPFHNSSVRTNTGLLFYWFASRSAIWHAYLTKIVVVSATWKWLWCWQSPTAPGKEACAQADREVLDRGRSGELGRDWPGGLGHGVSASQCATSLLLRKLSTAPISQRRRL